MNTLKRKLTAILLTFAMLFSLMPALPQAAEARDFGLVENEYITYQYPKPATGIDSAAGVVTVIVQDSQGNQLSSDVIEDYAKRLTGTNSITLKDPDQYDIEKIEMSNGPVTMGNYGAKEASFEWTFDAFGKEQTLTITLCDPYEAPEVIDPIDRTAVSYRVGYDQLLKLMYSNSVTKVSEATEIIKVKPIWVQSYGESYKELNFIGGTVGDDYWNQIFTSTSANDVNPENMRYLEVTYNDGTGEKVTKIPAKMMRFTGSSDKTYYQIESANEDVHVVAFYNETSSMTGDQYDLYAVRFVVDPEQTVGEENMPADPIYNESLSDYKFVNWEIDGYYGDNGEAFLPTTIVDRDMNVYAHKVSSSYSGGTEIRVMNEYGDDTNQLLDRLVEGYNEKYSTNISTDQIDMSSVKVQVNGTDGKYTNEYYYSNAWHNQGEYYLVHNYDAPGVPGGIDENQNTHIGFNEVSGIVVFFSLTGQSEDVASVTIPVGNNAGDLAKMMKGVGADHILQLYVVQEDQVIDQPDDPQPPTTPTYEELKALIDVAVDCSTNGHDSKTADLIANTDGQNNSYTLSVTGNTATVTVHNGPYVAWYDEQYEGISHSLVAGEQEDQTVELIYDNGWKLKDNATSSTTVHFDVVCSGTTPEPGEGITGLAKELVSTAEDAAAAVGTSKGYAFPENGVVVIPNGGTVKLLYSITVEGTANTTFTVTDTDAELVEVAGIDVEDGNDSGTFVGTIPTDGSITFYVAKTFDSDSIEGGNLINTASILEGQGDDTEDPGIDDPEVNTPAEEEPALPDKDTLKEMFDVELDCTSNVGHENQTYDIRYGDVEWSGIVRDKNGTYTVTMTVDGNDYLESFKEDSDDVVHKVVGDSTTQTITLIYDNDNDAWTAPENSSPIEFDVQCSGTGDYDINNFTKDLIAGESEKTTAQNDGVAVENYNIPAEDEPVVIPYNGEVTLLYKLTVTGNSESSVNFVVTDEGAELVKAVGDAEIVFNAEEDTFTGIVPADESVSFYVSKTFDADDIIDGKLVNEALIAGTGEDEDASVDPGIDDIEEEVGGEEGEPAGTVTITPADLTIYEGGEGGYDAVVNEDGNQVEAAESTSLPHPLFKITVPDGSSIDPETLTFTNGSNVWEVVHDGDNLYHFEVAEEGMTPVRVTYTNAAGKVVTSDEFTPEENSYAEYTIRLYPGNNADDFSNVTAIADDGARYAINAKNQTGKLTVRAVDGTQEESVSAIVTNENADSVEKVDAGEAVAVEPENGTTYSLNDTEVKVDENDSKPSLLFDTIIDDEVNRTEMLEDKVDEALGGADADRDYEIKYIDLVDANNGNAWIASENGTDILWGYPEGTDIDTEFQILHFKGLHRDGETTGFDPEELGAIDVNDESQLEHVTITNTDEGILFHVDKANFSPFALTWETDNGGSDTPGGDTPGGNDPWYPPYNPGDDDKPSGLNTEDHFSYVVGYEDGMVKPQRSITRAEVATIFYRLLEDDVRDDYDTTRNNFSDVTSDSWYNQTVSTLASMGILKGYEDGTFRPNASITRAEFAAIATRFFEETGATYEPGTFTDVTGDEWFAGAIMDAVNLGLIGGYEDGTVRPNNNITRAEACAIVNRTLGRVPDADHLLPADEMTTWPDNPSSAWFYADMQEATNGHEYEWITEDGNKIEEWTDILDKDWNDR